MPAELLLLRHGEKPDDNVRSDLSFKGCIRAAALAVYLPNRFWKPSHLFATKQSRESNRPALTLQPLSQSLGLTVDTRFEDAEYKSLAQELVEGPKYENAQIVICWHHGMLPQLARALGVRDAPDKWDDDAFDRIWHIEGFPAAVSMNRLHQKLLFGDRD